MSLRSPLSKALGLGSAEHGFSHWWWQRVTAVALVPLTIWFVYSVVSIVGESYENVHAWLAAPLNATLMLLFILTSLFHAQTGLQVVIEDYVHTKWINLSMLMIIKFASVGLAVFATIAVLKVAIGG